jgi:hypothetical protein
MHLDRGSAEESFANRGGKCGALGGDLGAFQAMKIRAGAEAFCKARAGMAPQDASA